MKRGVLFAGLLAAGGGVTWWQGAGGAAEAGGPASSSTFTVRRGDLEISITENGTLVAKDSQKVVPQFRSEGKIVFLAEEGRAVAEGEVICKVDTASVQTQIEQQETEIVQAEAAFMTAKTELEITIGENAASIEKARIALETMSQKDEKYREGDAPQDRRVLDISIKEADTDHLRANKRYEDSKKLLDQNFIKKSELEQHEIDLERATVKLEGARRALELFDKYTRPMTLRQNETAVKDAQRDLETAEKRSKSKLNQKEADVLQSEKRIKQLKTRLDERRKDVENMTMKAPCPGILIYGDPREPWYREQVKVGGTVWGGNTLMTIPDLRVMQVKIEVHEADINKVKVGQAASVTMDTYPGLQLHGEVARIANLAATGNPWQPTASEVKRFDVEILIKDTAELQLKPGISAKAEIHVDLRKDALFVPLQCVFLEAGVHQCLVLEAGAPMRREVKVGLNNDTYTEILSGLEVGQQVMLHNPSLPAGDDGAGANKTDKTEKDKGDKADGKAVPAVVEAAATPGAAKPAEAGGSK